MSTPSTVTEAVTLLHELGYTDDVELVGASAACIRASRTQPLSTVIVDHTFRFEGDSDPGDEAIVLGLRFPDTDVKGVLVSAFGPDADPETAAFFATLRHT